MFHYIMRTISTFGWLWLAKFFTLKRCSLQLDMLSCREREIRQILPQVAHEFRDLNDMSNIVEFVRLRSRRAPRDSAEKHAADFSTIPLGYDRVSSVVRPGLAVSGTIRR